MAFRTLAAASLACSVLAAEPTQTVLELAETRDDLTTVVNAISASDLVDTLSGPGPYTLFAPSNDAFGKLHSSTLDGLLKPENNVQLAKILSYHVVQGQFLSSDFSDPQLVCEEGYTHNNLKIQWCKKQRFLQRNSFEVRWTYYEGGSAQVTAEDLQASNGVVHVVDTVFVGAPAVV